MQLGQFNRGCLIGFVVALASADIAQVPPSGPPVDPWTVTLSQPNYYSATNNRAIATATWVGQGEQRTLVAMWLYIGSQVVAFDSFLEPMLDWEQSVMWDSTVFPFGSFPETRVVILDSEADFWERTHSAPVINRALLFGRYDLEGEFITYNHETGNYSFGDENWTGVKVSKPLLEAINYDCALDTTFWAGSLVLQTMPTRTVLHLHSHGDAAKFWDDQNDYSLAYPSNPPSLPARSIFPLNATLPHVALFPQRILDHGSGPPPFNTGWPPITLAFIDACETGLTNAYAEALLYPYGNAYTGLGQPFPENQAQCGYQFCIKLKYTKECNQAFWGALANGYSAMHARNDAFYVYGPHKGASEVPTDFMSVWGDWHTKLRGAYDGLHEPSGTWFRRL